MSEELEWELYDIFETAMFAFPIYEHNGARQIVRYLLRRGILEEEIADAIEDSSIDLLIWLNRGGKNMVGEWVIAWINECRDEFLHEKLRSGQFHSDLDELDNQHVAYVDIRAGSPSTVTSHSEEPEDRLLNTNVHDDEPEGTSNQLQNGNNNNTHHNVELDHPDNLSWATTDENVSHCSHESTPPPLPPRDIRTGGNRTLTKFEFKTTEDLPDFGLDLKVLDKFYETTADLMTANSELYSSIPPKKSSAPHTLVSISGCDHNKNCKSMTFKSSDSQHCTMTGLPICPNCTCTIPHFKKPLEHEDSLESNISNHTYCDIKYFADSAIREMDFNFETVDREGPGFIYIMTDSMNSVPWSGEHHYKISSSRQPEKSLMEFKARDIGIELIWQIRVRHHSKAVDEVHSHLKDFNLHTNWYKCSLSTIMDAVSAVVKRYR